ncbi:MAG: UDP-2,3-diacylglucosamine diphosphatase, partial [Candidatus Sulfotelmatobacter sp.]
RLRLAPKVASGALAYARHHGADRIFCGHTHEAIHVEQDGIHYYNSGGWVDSRLTHLTIDELGVHIHEFNEHEHCERTDDRDSGQERGEADSALVDFADEAGLLEDVEYESVGR